MKAQPRFRLFPMPMHSALLFIVWLLLNNTVAPGHIVLGAFLAFIIPLLTSGLQDPQPSLRKPFMSVRYILRVLGDIVVANFEVALLVLGPGRKLKPAIVAVPVNIQHEFPLSILASTISLTPGTVSTEISQDKQWIYVHALHMEDKDELINTIKSRYEAPLKEIFEC